MCVAAPSNTEYWIVSRTQDGDDTFWFAKTDIDGERTTNATYQLELLNGSGEAGNERSFVVVAARSEQSQRWLDENLEADRVSDDNFDRSNLPGAVDVVSNFVESHS